MMKFNFFYKLVIYAVIAIAFLPSNASELTSEMYWKTKVGDIPMPKTLKGSLPIGSNDAVVKFNLNYKHKNVKPEDAFQWEGPTNMKPEDAFQWEGPNNVKPEDAFQWEGANNVKPEDAFQWERPNNVKPEDAFQWERPNNVKPEDAFQWELPNNVKPEDAFQWERPNNVKPKDAFQWELPNNVKPEDAFQWELRNNVKPEDAFQWERPNNMKPEDAFQWERPNNLKPEDAFQWEGPNNAKPEDAFQWEGPNKKPQIHQDGRLIYFMYDTLSRVGTKMKLHFDKINNEVKFLPLHVAKTVSATSNKLQAILNLFSVNPKSIVAQDIEAMMKKCEGKGVKDEKRYCANTLEGMVDYVTKSLNSGKNKLMVASTEVDDDILMEYTIQKVQNIGSDDNQNMLCHKMSTPYAVFLCHNIKSTSLYDVTLVGADGKNKKAIAACHKDTTLFNPKHVSFELLKSKPGGKPICHFLSANAIAWFPK